MQRAPHVYMCLRGGRRSTQHVTLLSFRVLLFVCVWKCGNTSGVCVGVRLCGAANALQHNDAHYKKTHAAKFRVNQHRIPGVKTMTIALISTKHLQMEPKHVPTLHVASPLQHSDRHHIFYWQDNVGGSLSQPMCVLQC